MCNMHGGSAETENNEYAGKNEVVLASFSSLCSVLTENTTAFQMCERVSATAESSLWNDSGGLKGQCRFPGVSA